MNIITRYGLKFGIMIQAVTAGFFVCVVNPITTMSVVCLCFILFAELELFGTIALLFQYAVERVPLFTRAGVSIVTALYACAAIIVAIAFVPYDLAIVKSLLVIQIVLLGIMVLLDALVIGISRLIHRT